MVPGLFADPRACSNFNVLSLPQGVHRHRFLGSSLNLTVSTAPQFTAAHSSSLPHLRYPGCLRLLVGPRFVHWGGMEGGRVGVGGGEVEGGGVEALVAPQCGRSCWKESSWRSGFRPPGLPHVCSAVHTVTSSRPSLPKPLL